MENILAEGLTEIQKQILDGHLLGDGYIHKTTGNGNGRFEIERKGEDNNYLLWSIKNFENFIYRTSLSNRGKFLKITQKFYSSCEFYTKQSPIFSEYYNKWYGSGKKKVPEDLELTPLLIAVWFCDDGHARVRYGKFPSIRISTDGFEKDEVELLISKLNQRYGEMFKIGKTL